MGPAALEDTWKSGKGIQQGVKRKLSPFQWEKRAELGDWVIHSERSIASLSSGVKRYDPPIIV